MITAQGTHVARGRNKPLSVLIVEDERLVARDLERSLGDMGYEVTASVATGDGAVRAARKRRPDVVLMDIRIKGVLDGIDTAHILSRSFRVPVVYMTAYTDDETVARASKTAPYGYIVKPFSPREVRSAIETASYKHELDMRLEARERWFSTTLRAIGDAVVACGPDQCVEFMNPVAESLTGWTEHEAAGRKIDDVIRFISPEAERIENPVVRALRDGTVQTIPPASRLLERSGERSRLVDDTAAPIMHDGALLGAVLVFRDVTEQRQLEEQMALTERLSSLGAVAASIGHEINNPLTYNLANLSFVSQQLDRMTGTLTESMDGKEIQDLRKALSEAQEGAERIAKVVADLRMFSRAEEQALRRIDVRVCIDWALKLIGNKVEHAARLRKDLGRMPHVLANEIRLSQVFVNLLENAAQAIEGRPEANEIRIVGTTDAVGQAVVEIHDTGAGIPEHVAARIFEPFFTTKASSAGAGLGLSICRDVVNWLGGSLTASSRPGQGTCFRLVLPAAGGAASADTRSPSSRAAPRRTRILVVDEDLALGRTIHRVLAEHDVTVLQNGGDALALVRAELPFDVILCDIMMPDMSGLDFHEELSRVRPDMAARVAFMTGGPLSDRAVDFLRTTAPRCINKPFSPDELMAFIAGCSQPRPKESLH